MKANRIYVISILAFLLIITSHSLIAQADLKILLEEPQEVEVTEITEPISLGLQPGLMVNIPYADAGSVANAWRSFTKNFGGRNINQSDELFTDNATIPNLTGNTVDIYTILEPYGDGVFLKSFVDLGGAFVSSEHNYSYYQTVENLLYDFANIQAAEQLNVSLLEEEEKLMEIKFAREQLKSEEQSLLQEIAEYKTKIAMAEQSLALNKSKQKEANVIAKDQVTHIEQLHLNLKTIVNNAAYQKGINPYSEEVPVKDTPKMKKNQMF